VWATPAYAATQTIKMFAGSGDGQSGINNTEAQTTWSAARSYTGTIYTPPQYDQTTNSIRSDQVSGIYWLRRGTLPFDTSVIPSEAVINSATLYLYGQTTSGSQGGAKACITTNTRNNPTAVVGSDYYISNYGSEIASSTALANYQYTAFGFNTTGLNHISVSSVTVIGVRTHFDCENIDPGADGPKAVNYYSSEASGTSTDPYLEITYTVPDTVVTLQTLRDAIDNDVMNRETNKELKKLAGKIFLALDANQLSKARETIGSL
jgi:hypothetical protein